MQIRFNASLESGEAEISKATLRDLAQLSPLLRADLLKDVVFDATEAYNAALIAMREEWQAARNAQG
jgi:hypothetical protein